MLKIQNAFCQDEFSLIMKADNRREFSNEIHNWTTSTRSSNDEYYYCLTVLLLYKVKLESLWLPSCATLTQEMR